MSDSRTTSRVRLTQPAASVCPALTIEQFLTFPVAPSLDDLASGLRTTGFEGFEDRQQAKASPVAPEAPAPAQIKIEIPRPLLEVRPAAATAAIYEPMEFLDYDDEDALAEVEPERVETFEPPAVLTAFLTIPKPNNVAPSAAKTQPGFTWASFVDPPIEFPALPFATVRKKLVYGPNPFKLRAAPVAKPAAAPRVPRAVVYRPAVGPATASAAASAAAPVIKAEPTRAVPVEEVAEEATTPLPKPKMVPIRKPEPVTAAASVLDGPMIGLPQTERSGGAKIAMVAAVLVTLAVGGYAVFPGGSLSTNAKANGAADNATSGMIIGGGGWTTTWGADAPNNKDKHISIYRPSMPMSDYRFEFRGQIERKALGWLFRASNPRNYYVMKLATIKPGPNPLVALVKYAVINGKETTHTQVMMPFDVNAGTVYHVRLDVRGNRFETYVQEKLVDHWTDDRIKVGGAGFYTETGERSQIKSSQVSYLK